jgi:hypothetical protein
MIAARHQPTFTSLNRRIAAVDREIAFAVYAGNYDAAKREQRRVVRLVTRARRLARRIAA